MNPLEKKTNGNFLEIKKYQKVNQIKVKKELEKTQNEIKILNIPHTQSQAQNHVPISVKLSGGFPAAYRLSAYDCKK